jgi:hypothetical protein
MSAQAIKAYKGIPAKEDLPDRMGAAELAANSFVRTQTEQKITRDGIQGEAVISTHQDVGTETRDLIARLGGIMPEDLSPEPSIRAVLDQRARRHRQQKHLPEQSGQGLFDLSDEVPNAPGKSSNERDSDPGTD